MYFSPYPLQRIEEVGAWAGSVALTEQCRSSNGFVGILSATTFVDTPQAPSPTLSLLETCLVAPECLQLEVNQPTLLAALLGNPLVGFPACALLRIVCDYFLQSPSPRLVAICSFSHRGLG